MEWISPRDHRPKDKAFIYVKFPNGNIKMAQFLENGYPKNSFWFDDGKFFIIWEKILEWSMDCMKCHHFLDSDGTCAVCEQL